MSEVKFEHKGEQSNAQVAIVMGSASDWPQMEKASEILKEFNISHTVDIVSAHRSPDKMFRFAEKAASNGLKVIIAGAGGAAHLPGMLASKTTVPVVGVPIMNGPLNGQDALYSIVQMHRGIPVATVGIGNATNAGLLAAQILASYDESIRSAVEAYRNEQAHTALAAELTHKN
jgi:5-(carboxyamino)imidazole ribonucleotide mutase